MFLKDATSDQSDKTFLHALKIATKMCLFLPWSFLYIYEIEQNIILNNEAKGFFLKQVQNDGNNKSFKILLELVPNFWLYAHALRLLSNDDPGLTLTIFMTGSNLFPDASVWVTAKIALSALVFPILF